jgi:hypothetical protein
MNPAPKVFEAESKTIRGRFFPQGASAPTVPAASNRGVASITRTAAGTFLITLSDAYRRLISAQATVQHTTAVNLVPQFGDVSNIGTSSPATFVLRLNAVATATDMAANANNSVAYELEFADSDAY